MQRGRTVVIIAHRLSTVERADRIVVIDRGRVREQGAHADLLKQGGMYASLVSKQLLAFHAPPPTCLIDRVLDNVRSYMPDRNMFSRNQAPEGASNANVNSSEDGASGASDSAAPVSMRAPSRVIPNSITASYGSIGSFHSAGSLTEPGRTVGGHRGSSPGEASLRTPLSVSPNSGFESA